MKYYPIFLDVRDRNCLVVGAGEVGTRKAMGLARSGASVRVVSKKFSQRLGGVEGVILEEKDYETSDLDTVFMVFAATNNNRLNLRIQKEAKEKHILCNIADCPDNSDFILPSVVERGDLVCAVSTSGASPALAKKIRRDLLQMFGPEYTDFLRLMGNLRKKLLEEGHDPLAHKKVFTALVEKQIPALIAAKDEARIDLLLGELLGPGYDFKSLVPQEQ
jgi:precorrin-2 dehydrogenase/sirohydrochlorin ferrochelatase